MITKTLREELAARLRAQIAIMSSNGSNCAYLLRRLNKLTGR